VYSVSRISTEYQHRAVAQPAAPTAIGVCKCRLLAYAGKSQRRIVAAWIGIAFAQDDATAARKQWREVADQARPR